MYLFRFLAYDPVKNPRGSNVINCIPFQQKNESMVCNVIINDSFSPCTRKDGFNYNNPSGGPCFFLKLNKIFGWKPQYYEKEHLPNNMPPALKQYIKEVPDNNEVIKVSGLKRTEN